MPLRVSPEGEMVGLNQAEHGAGSAMLDLVNDMERHRSEGYFAQPVRVVIGSEVESIALQYNRVIQRVNSDADKLRRAIDDLERAQASAEADRKSTRLNSSH